MKTACQLTPGMCAGDPRCADRQCPGHPCQHARPGSAIRAEGRASAGAALLLYIACAFAAVVCVGAVL